MSHLRWIRVYTKSEELKNRDILLKNFGLNVKNKRKSLGLSQSELADLSLLTVAYIGKVERGDFSFSLACAFSIANALKISFVSLIEESLP